MNKIRLSRILNIIPIFILFIYYYTTSFKVSVSTFIPLLLLLFWFVQSSLLENPLRILFNNKSKWWMLYMVLCYFMTIVGISSNNINYQISNTPVFFIPLIGIFVLRNYNNKELKLLLFLCLIVFMGNIIQNFIIWKLYPELFVDVKRHVEEEILFKSMMNIPPTSFITVCLIFVGTFLTALFNVKDKCKRVFIFLLIIVVLIYMFVVNVRATAIIFLSITFMGFFIARKEPQNNRNKYYITISLIFVIVVLLFIIPIMSFVIQYIENEKLIKRFADIVSFIDVGGNTNHMEQGSFSGRLELIMVSLNSWLSSPVSLFIGIGEHAVDFGGDLRKSGIGGHSQHFDTLARFGLLGAIVFYNIYKSYYRSLKALACTGNRDIIKYLNVVVVVYLLYGFFNNIIAPMTLFFSFVLLPVIIKLLVENKLVSHENSVSTR